MSYLVDHWQEVLQLLGEHVRITAIAMTISIAIGVPLGILISRVKALGPIVLGAAGIFYLIPSLALFAVLVPFTGLGPRPAIIGLVLYAQLAIVRNTATGILGVSPTLLQAAEGMGMTRVQRLFMLELPLALPVITAGVRVATVMSIGVATIAAYVGAGGLGTLIFQGMRMLYPEMVIAGALPASILAILVDLAFVTLERLLSRNLPVHDRTQSMAEQPVAA